MTPRRYRMGARAEAVAETRAVIVQAAMHLHAEQGVLVTSWDDIAARADVATATVYRHFPSLAELVPACARTVFDIIEPPTLEQAQEKFAVLEDAPDRLEQLVRDSCTCYAKGEGWLHAAHRERDFVPELDRALGILDTSLEVLIAAAVGEPLEAEDGGILFVLCDFPFWRSLIARGLSRPAAEEVIVRLVRREAARLTGGKEAAP